MCLAPANTSSPRGVWASPNQLVCKVTGDYITDSRTLLSKLAFVQAVCCQQLHEHCPGGSPLPSQCAHSACARAVSLVAAACGPLLESQKANSFFKPQKDALNYSFHNCVAAGQAGAGTEAAPVNADVMGGGRDDGPHYVVTDPALQVRGPPAARATPLTRMSSSLSR